MWTKDSFGASSPPHQEGCAQLQGGHNLSRWGPLQVTWSRPYAVSWRRQVTASLTALAQRGSQAPGVTAGASSEARPSGIPLKPRASGRTASTWFTPIRLPSKASAEPAMYNRHTLARPALVS